MGTVAEADLFKENFDNAVKNIALARTVIRDDICQIAQSTAAEEHFYQETAGDITSSTQIPKDADFIADQLRWTRVTVRPRKFGTESRMSWEDTIISAIDIPARTTMRIGNIVARNVDTRAWNVTTEDQSAVAIATLATSA